MLAPHRADDYDEAHPAVPSNGALHHLTKLTRLQLQASSPWPNKAADEHWVCCVCFAATTTFAAAITQRACAEALPLWVPQVAGVEPANGSIQPSVTRLDRLARLHVGSTLEGNVCELPPGFGGLSLTSLSFSMVSLSLVKKTMRSCCHT